MNDPFEDHPGVRMLKHMTDEEYRQRREQLWKHHVLYLCPDCREGFWMDRGGGLPNSFPCGAPCWGRAVRQRPPQWWEESDDVVSDA